MRQDVLRHPKVPDPLCLSFSLSTGQHQTNERAWEKREGPGADLPPCSDDPTLSDLGGAPIHWLGGLNKANEEDHSMSRKKKRGQEEQERRVEGLEHLYRPPP